MILPLLFDRGRGRRLEAIRAAHRRLGPGGLDETGILGAVCEALCPSGAYRTVVAAERRPDATVRLVASSGARMDTPPESLPCWNEPLGQGALPTPFPLRKGRAALLPVPVGGEPRLALVVAAPERAAFGAAELEDLAALAARAGQAIASLRLGARFEALKKGYESVSAALEAERDFGLRLLDSVPVPVVQLGPEGEIRLFNRRIETITGFRSSEVLNRRMADILLPEPVRSDFRRLVVGLFIGRGQQGVPFQLLTRGGDPVLLTWTFSPIPEEGGRIASILAFGESTNVLRKT